ncbi:DMT family protein [Gilliamella sp. CG35]|uniref:DMT family protein n=1 Tax=Gilliamella sp. CG35 TaxID=3351507 RepID=UPI003986700D
MNQLFITICLLIFSNMFMTFAWYGHLRFLHNQVWIVAVFISWGIALFEYLLQVPANRIGFQAATAGQLKIIQEVISLSVFIPFSIYILKEPFKTDYIWAGCCLLGAVFFMFRDKIFAS